MKILIKPYSKIFFGDGRSINKGEAIFAGKDFYINSIPFFSLFGKIKNIFLCKNEKTILFPIPKDIIFLKREDNNKKYKLGKYKLKIQDKKILLLPNLDKKQKIKDINAFFHENKLKEYLQERLSENSFYEEYKDLIKTQIIPNISLDRVKKITNNRMLSFKVVNEFKEEINNTLYIFVETEKDNNKIGKEIYYLLGGETSVATAKILKSDEIDLLEGLKNENFIKNIKNKIIETKYFKIVLLTPTNYPPEIKGAKLIAQITGKLIPFSGWFNIYDNSSKKIDGFPSRLFKLIPSGAVFYYKLEDERELEKIFDNFWLKPAFFVKEYPYFERLENGTNPLGFGLSIIGVANIEEN